jgi:hypothetical protein
MFSPKKRIVLAKNYFDHIQAYGKAWDIFAPRLAVQCKQNNGTKWNKRRLKNIIRRLLPSIAVGTQSMEAIAVPLG